MSDEKIEHPSFGTIKLSRQHGGDRRLFGSALRHGAWLSISISTASLTRSHGHDHVFGNDDFVEVHLSEVDFARFIASAGIGEGTPCTINRREIDGKYQSVPEPPQHKATVNTFKAEATDRIEKAVAGAKEAMRDVSALRLKKGVVTKVELSDLFSKLRMAVQELESNAPFMIQQAEDTIEKMAVKAKGEIEAFMRNTATSMGIEQMQTNVVALSSPEEEK